MHCLCKTAVQLSVAPCLETKVPVTVTACGKITLPHPLSLVFPMSWDSCLPFATLKLCSQQRFAFLLRSWLVRPNKSPVWVNARKLNYQWLLGAIWQKNRFCKISQQWLPTRLGSMTGLAFQRLSSWTISESPSCSLTDASIKNTTLNLLILDSFNVYQNRNWIPNISTLRYHAQPHLRGVLPFGNFRILALWYISISIIQ